MEKSGLKGEKKSLSVQPDTPINFLQLSKFDSLMGAGDVLDLSLSAALGTGRTSNVDFATSKLNKVRGILKTHKSSVRTSIFVKYYLFKVHKIRFILLRQISQAVRTSFIMVGFYEKCLPFSFNSILCIEEKSYIKNYDQKFLTIILDIAFFFDAYLYYSIIVRIMEYYSLTVTMKWENAGIIIKC